MDQQIKEKWVKALRSGEYKKGLGQLKNNQDITYCCIGVLGVCNNLQLYNENDSKSVAIQPNSFKYNYGISELLGLTSDEERFLIKLNDNPYSTFEEIANHIENNL